MLKQVLNNAAVVECNRCKTTTTHDLTGIVLPFLPEFNEYMNLSLECPNCTAFEIFNVNIPEDESNDYVPLSLLPVYEDIQRYYVRLLMRMIREDFVNGTTK